MDLDAAGSDIQNSLENNFHCFDTCPMMDYVFKFSRQGNIIAGYLNQLLKLKPGHQQDLFRMIREASLPEERSPGPLQRTEPKPAFNGGR